MATTIEGEPVIPLDPLMKLLQLRFVLTSNYTTPAEKVAAEKQMLEEVKANSMAPYYELLCEGMAWDPDVAMTTEMHKVNDKTVVELRNKIEDAEKNFGDSEVLEATLNLMNHYARVGDREPCQEVIKTVREKTIGNGTKMDLCFLEIRLGLAFSDNQLVDGALQTARVLLKDAEWERRNRFKVYEGIYLTRIRQFKKGAEQLLEALPTFASTELIDQKDFVFVTIAASLINLDRPTLKKSIVDSPEVIASNVGSIYDLAKAIHQCQYHLVFGLLERSCLELRNSVFLTLHVNYFYREVRILVFKQFLESYSSVTLQSMADSFRIPVQVLDQMLWSFISNDRMSCKMDRISGTVQTYQGESINRMYHTIVKEGDLVINRLQKLAKLAGA